MRSDLQAGSVLGLIGATQQGTTAYNTYKNKSLARTAINSGLALGIPTIVGGTVPGAVRAVAGKSSGFFFPTPPIVQTEYSISRGNVS